MNRIALLAIAVALVSGCESPGPARTAVSHDALYDGGRQLLYEVEREPGSVGSMAQADAARRSGDNDRALFLYLQVAEEQPELSAPMIQVSRIHRARGNQDLAERALREILQRQPDDLPALAELGVLQLALQRRSEAAATLQHALEVDQRRLRGSASQPQVDRQSPLRLYHGLGVLADLAGNFEQARSYYQLARQIEPRSALLANSEGYSRYLSGDWAAAQQHYREALAIDGRYRQAWRNLGLLLARQGHFEDALAAFEQVEGRAQASNDVGYVCMLDGRLGEAGDFFRQAIELSPAHYDTARQNLQRVEQLQRLRQGS